MAWLVLIAALVALSWVAILVVYRREVMRAWREPVIGCPVLIFESDDWGPGPAFDAEALHAIAALLGEFRDCGGRCPVMTLGVALSLVDTDKMRDAAQRAYAQLRLDDPHASDVLAAMRDGAVRGVFEIQLHGMAHYWPAALLRAAQTDGAVSAWLRQPGWARTEQLPSALQSRWTDASTLPSRPLGTSEVAAAVAEEIGEFERVFGARPRVVVPPTFVWTDDVEANWARHGIEILVCPGRQFTSRGARGELIDAGRTIRNGDCSPAGLGCVVRNIYFEPERGHTALSLLPQIEASFRRGRAALLETHRSNFIGNADLRARSLRELGSLLALALERFHDLRFIGTARLGRAQMQRDPAWVDTRRLRRIACMLQRLRDVPRCGRLMRVTGLTQVASATASLADCASLPAVQDMKGNR